MSHDASDSSPALPTVRAQNDGLWQTHFSVRNLRHLRGVVVSIDPEGIWQERLAFSAEWVAVLPGSQLTSTDADAANFLSLSP